MQIIYEDDAVRLRFDSPATMELDQSELDFSDHPNLKSILLDFRGVKLIGSMVLAGLMALMDRYRSRCDVRLLNLEPEMRNLLGRTGLGSWLDMTGPSGGGRPPARPGS